MTLVAGGMAMAAFVPDVGYSSDNRKSAVNVNHRTAIIFRASNGKMGPNERAKVTAERLQPLADNGGWRTLHVKLAGRRRAQLVAGDRLICVATAADAKRAGVSASALAYKWLENLRTLFAMPPVTVAPREIVIPEGECRIAKIGGALTSSVDSNESCKTVAGSSVDQSRRAVIIRGKSVGVCTIELNCEGYKTSVVVSVRRYAGKIARRELAEVTGNPAPGWIVSRAAAQRAGNTLRVEPGAEVSYGKPRAPKALKSGTCAKAFVPVRIDGPGLIPVSLFAPVDVCNRQISRLQASQLLYSNNPERVKKFGPLFTAQIQSGTRNRLLFHHQNELRKRMKFTVEIINAGGTTATVHSVSGCTNPIVDPVTVGYRAGQSFIHDYLGNVGQVFHIPAMSKLVLYTDHVAAKETASGIMDIQTIEGQNLYVQVRADQPGSGSGGNGAVGAIDERSIPRQLSDDVYQSPTQKVEASYNVGDRWSFIRIGKEPIVHATLNKQLYGNYGVIYYINLRMSNPTGDPKTVRVVFEPSAGPASGLFLVDGKMIGARVVRPPSEFEITRARLAPGDTKHISIMTIPLAGSAYPASILVRS